MAITILLLVIALVYFYRKGRGSVKKEPKPPEHLDKKCTAVLKFMFLLFVLFLIFVIYQKMVPEHVTVIEKNGNNWGVYNFNKR